jgi:hypothetical protein
MSSSTYRINLSGCTNDIKTVENIIQTIDKNQGEMIDAYNNKLKNLQNIYYDSMNANVPFEKELQTEEAKTKQENINFLSKLVAKNNEGKKNIGRIINDIDSSKYQLLVNNQNYTNIRSLNQQNLAVSNVPGTNDYMIHLNDNCLDVSGNNTYSVQPCNKYSLAQRFTLNPVHNNDTYFTQFKSNPDSVESYPYNLVKSKLTGLCLEENNGNILLNKCQSLNGQKWRGFQQ